jgi:5'-nucleotidase
LGKPFFLLCNDDGVHAPGIKALATAIEPFGDWIMVAPHVEKSGFGQALSLVTPLRTERLSPNVYAVEGTPTDCMIFALNKLLDRKPDYILSGINRGSNIGQDTIYSGTVAAAMQGAVDGIPSVAFSLKGRPFELAAYADSIKVIRTLFEHRELLAPAKHGVLNVNIPDCPIAQMRGFAVTRLGRRIYDNSIAEAVDPRGRPYYWIGGGGEDIERTAGTDCHMLYDNFVTLTTLVPDHTDPVANDRLKAGLETRLTEALRSVR